MTRLLELWGWEFSDCPLDMGNTSICDIHRAKEIVEELKSKDPYYEIGLTSGGFDPLHPGHISCILDAKLRCDTLIVIINGDEFIRRKKNVTEPFQPIQVRTQIISAIKGVDYAVPFDASDLNDLTICEALEIIKPTHFFKGGDRRDAQSIPEWEICQRLGIEIVLDMGDDKKWSSSDFLRKWEEMRNNGTKSI